MAEQPLPNTPISPEEQITALCTEIDVNLVEQKSSARNRLKSLIHSLPAGITSASSSNFPHKKTV